MFFLWVIVRDALGGWELGWFLLSAIGLPAWIALGVVVALVLYRSDYRMDLPLFVAGYALGYWGEWWGTTHSTSTSCGLDSLIPSSVTRTMTAFSCSSSNECAPE